MPQLTIATIRKVIFINMIVKWLLILWNLKRIVKSRILKCNF